MYKRNNPQTTPWQPPATEPEPGWRQAVRDALARQRNARLDVFRAYELPNDHVLTNLALGTPAGHVKMGLDANNALQVSWSPQWRLIT